MVIGHRRTIRHFTNPLLGVGSAHSRHVKAESLRIIRIGHRPICQSVFCNPSPERAKYFNYALSGLTIRVTFKFVGRCPTLLIYKAFSLKMTAMGFAYVASMRRESGLVWRFAVNSTKIVEEIFPIIAV